MTTRVLPREEWWKLDATKQPQFWHYCKPDDIQIVVVEDGARIVACAAVVRAVCIEGVWLDGDHRNAATGRGLIRGMLSAARKWADAWAFGAVGSDLMHDVMQRMDGERLDAAIYMLPLRTRAERMGVTKCA